MCVCVGVVGGGEGGVNTPCSILQVAWSCHGNLVQARGQLIYRSLVCNFHCLI